MAFMMMCIKWVDILSLQGELLQEPESNGE